MLRSIDKKIKIIFYIFLILFLSTFNNTNIHELKKNFFLIENIKINGLNEKLTLDINSKLEKYLRSNLLLLNREFIKNDMNEFPFIESYTIFKKYPSQIILNIKETELIAKTFDNNKIEYIGSNGKIIGENYYENKKKLPNVFGNFKTSELLRVFLLLENNNFMLSEITDLYYFNSGRWDVKFKNNLLIKLPINKLDNSINIAKKFIEKEKITENIIIDLRVANQVIISNE